MTDKTNKTKPKVSIIGAGAVGSTTAYALMIKNIADIAIVDIVEGLPQGKALDIQQSAPLFNSDCRITGSNSYFETKNSDVIVMTAGLPRKPGMTREDLIKTNQKIIDDVIKRVAMLSPKAVLIVVTNPMDTMAYAAMKASGFSKQRVIGIGGVLDSSRFKTFIAEKAKVSPDKVEAMVIGQHGQEMICLRRLAKVNEKPLADVLSKEDIDYVCSRTINSGGEIVNLLKTASTCFAPAVSIAEMVDAILNDKKTILPCSVFLEGEYGIKNVFVGVPVVLGRKGIEKIVELQLDNSEKDALIKCAESLKKLIEIL